MKKVLLNGRAFMFDIFGFQYTILKNVKEIVSTFLHTLIFRIFDKIEKFTKEIIAMFGVVICYDSCVAPSIVVLV